MRRVGRTGRMATVRPLVGQGVRIAVSRSTGVGATVRIRSGCLSAKPLRHHSPGGSYAVDAALYVMADLDVRGTFTGPRPAAGAEPRGAGRCAAAGPPPEPDAAGATVRVGVDESGREHGGAAAEPHDELPRRAVRGRVGAPDPRHPAYRGD